MITDSKFLDFADVLEELGRDGQWSVIEHSTKFFKHAFKVAGCWNNCHFKNGEVEFQSRDGKRTFQLTFRKIAVLDEYDCDYDILLREVNAVNKKKVKKETLFFFTIPATYLLGG